MSENIKVAGALVFPEGAPTRAGEIVNSIDEILNIPAPRVGMIVYDKSTGINYIVRSLKAKVIDGVLVDNAQVDGFEQYDIIAEKERAEAAEAELGEAIGGVHDALAENDEAIKNDAMNYRTLSATHYGDKVVISGDNLKGEKRTTDISAATEEKAGVMSAEDKKRTDTIALSEDVEERLEVILDKEGKVLAYRDKDGGKHEDKLHINKELVMSSRAISALEKTLRRDGFANMLNDLSNDSLVILPITKSCAKVNIVSPQGLATTKTDDIKCKIQYWDKEGNFFEKYIILNAQGSSSMMYRGKNQGIDVYNDEACEQSCKIVFGNWLPQDSFHLKMYYIDVFRGEANICYNFCEEVIQFLNSRNNRNVSTSTDNSTGDFFTDFNPALCHPDGFPIELYLNGAYYGLFAWNLKKSRDNYSMDKNDYTTALLDGEIDYSTFFGGTIDWSKFELRNPKKLITMSGGKYDGDNPEEIIDSSSSAYDGDNPDHVNTALVKAALLRQAGAITDIRNIASPETKEALEAAKSKFAEYYDVEAMICYYIVANVLYHMDGFRKNWIWTLYDGIFAPSFYDMDSMFGRNTEGSGMIPSSLTVLLGSNSVIQPTHQLKRLYLSEIKDRYTKLRNAGVISVENIMNYVYDWTNRVGSASYRRNMNEWMYIPSYRGAGRYQDKTDGSVVTTGMFDSPARIKSWLEKRIAFVDTQFLN